MNIILILAFLEEEITILVWPHYLDRRTQTLTADTAHHSHGVVSTSSTGE